MASEDLLPVYSLVTKVGKATSSSINFLFIGLAPNLTSAYLTKLKQFQISTDNRNYLG